MHEPRFVTYYRVSTQAQGRSGLGLEAQRVAVEHYLRSREGKLIGQFTEIETGKGANALERRPELRSALDLCRKQGAVLVIAKLDRLARNVHFVTGLIESGVDFVAADMPHATKVMIQIHAVMAEHERDQISARTKAALAAAKARGVKLGVTGPGKPTSQSGSASGGRQTLRRAHEAGLRGLRAPGSQPEADGRRVERARDQDPEGRELAVEAGAAGDGEAGWVERETAGTFCGTLTAT